MPSFSPPVIARWVYPSLRWQYPAGEKKLYLTFDDGPHPDITPDILTLLDEYNAKATFFLLGSQVENYPELPKLILGKGHQLGNHSYSHPDGFFTSTSEYIKDVHFASSIIPSKIFRPPYGRIRPSQLKKISQDFEVIMWNVMSLDYNSGISTNEIYNHLLSKTRDGSIIVFHEKVKLRSRLFTVLPSFLSHFNSEGFCFSGIPEGIHGSQPE